MCASTWSCQQHGWQTADTIICTCFLLHMHLLLLLCCAVPACQLCALPAWGLPATQGPDASCLLVSLWHL
jgi:hypothetical protein